MHGLEKLCQCATAFHALLMIDWHCYDSHRPINMKGGKYTQLATDRN